MGTKRVGRNRGVSPWIFLLVFFGLLLVFLALGKSLVDVVVIRRVIDLAADDRIESGFLPVYAQEGALADPRLVAIRQTAQPFPTPSPEIDEVLPTRDPGLAPDRILIPSIQLDAPVTAVSAQPVQFEGETFAQWLAPDFRAAGWHNASVGLGVPGNTVLNGHHNIKGEVFRDLYQLQTGDEIALFSGGREFHYTVVYSVVVPERNQPLGVRLANAEWIQPTEDERITLITCWPYESNTHRVIVVAVPLRTSAAN